MAFMRALAVVLVAALALTLRSSYSATAETATPIKHVIIIVQENHSFDNYFGTYPTANGTLMNDVTSQLQPVDGIPNGICVPYGSGCLAPCRVEASSTESPIEGQLTYENDYDNGKMDGFAAFSGPQSMAYFDYNQIPAYWVYAEEYGLSDNYFSAALSTTNPNRLILLAGDTPVSQNDGPPPYLPYNQTILNQLSANGISWGYFDFLTPPQRFVPPINYLSGLNSNALNQVQDVQAFLHDLSDGNNLSSVSFVNAIGSDALDEHPPSNVTAGELWVVSIVNAVMESNYWNSSAIFLTYDEGGGYYDHVPPQQLLSIDHEFDHVLRGYGQRVPLLVISPFAKENYVSKTLLNHMSLLRFIDYNWNLQPLNQNVANSNNLLDFFYFNGPVRSPVILGSDGTYSAKKYPAPIQFPLSSLPYTRNSSTNVVQKTETTSTQVTLPIIAAFVLLTIVILGWRTRRSIRGASR
jgi:phospholipase C